MQSRSRGTRTIPYTHWGGECQSERAPAWSERTPFWTCVLDRTGKEREWMKKFEVGRSEIQWNYVTEHERQRLRDEQTKLETVWSNIHNWGTNPDSFLRKNDLPLEFWRGDCHSVREFFNFKPAINKNSQGLNRNWRETDRIHTQSKTNDRNELTTGQLYNKESRIITTIISSSNYWRVLMNGIGILKIRDEPLERRQKVLSILWLLNIFHSILDSHWLP